VDRVELAEQGVRENRRFYVIDDRDRMVNAKSAGELQSIVSRYDDVERRLELEFPDGRLMSGPVELDEALPTQFFSRPRTARPVLGEFSQAISDHVGQPLRLVEAGDHGAVDRGAHGAVSLISRASLERLAEQGALEGIDPRRFRMLIEIDGADAHAEDEWIGRVVAVGAAAIRPRGHVGRCLITSRDPDTGVIDVPTLDLLGAYRRDLGTTEPLAFGIYGEVLEPGPVQVGDAVRVTGG
jgi:uncharacterized protein YcbX